MLLLPPIPDQTELRTKKQGSRSYPIVLDSEENNEHAVDLRTLGIAGDNYYFREDNPPYMHRAPGAIAELYVREGIGKRLSRVNEALFALGLELYVFDAYRPIAVQNHFHDVWVPEYLKKLHPEWNEEKIHDETGNYWAKGGDTVDPLSPPPHATGGVIDLSIRKKDGELLFMGSDFDEPSEMSFADHFEHEGKTGMLNVREVLARDNRRLLYNVMTAEGFIVNPNEWWHFGYGDQMSAKLSGAPAALYSVLPLV